jgi:hypothetical protein
MSSFRRSPTRLLAVVVTILSLTALSLTLAPSVLAAPRLASSERSGALHVTKECSQYTGQADSFCTIVSSNLAAIKPGSRVVYLQAAGATALDSDVVLVVGPGNYALGHVNLPFPVGPGVVTFWGGTGDFRGFHARVVVTPDPNIVKGWYWNGTYHFTGRD